MSLTDESGDPDVDQPLPFKPLRAVKKVATPPTGGLEVEDSTAFLSRLADAPELAWHVDGLIPAEGICLWHGQPRDFKSLCAIEVALAMATGRAPFGAERFVTRRPVKVAFFAEEDSERLFAQRLQWMMKDSTAPAEGFLFPFIRQSLSFDDEWTRRDIIKVIKECGCESAIFDPLRSFTAQADKGPADFAPVTKFLRKIQNETQCKSLCAIHHDTKPLAMAQANPTRSRSQEASGGGIFSIADCPVGFKKLAWNKAAVFPEDYKLTGDPRSFQVTFESDWYIDNNGAPRFGSWVRPVAKTMGEEAMKDEATHSRIKDYLVQLEADNPGDAKAVWVSSRQVDSGAKLRKGQSSAVLDEMYQKGSISRVTGEASRALGRASSAILWRGVPNALPPTAPKATGAPLKAVVGGSAPAPDKGHSTPRFPRAVRGVIEDDGEEGQ